MIEGACHETRPLFVDQRWTEVKRYCDAVPSIAKLGTSPSCHSPTFPSNDWSQSPEGLVHGCAVRKHIKNSWIDDHDIRTLRIARGCDPAHGVGKIVFWAHRITVGLLSPSIYLLHIASVLAE